MKETPMKAVAEMHEYDRWCARYRSQRFRCPVCNEVVNAGRDFQPRYCWSCGQRLDFSDAVYVDSEFIGVTETIEVRELILP